MPNQYKCRFKGDFQLTEWNNALSGSMKVSLKAINLARIIDLSSEWTTWTEGNNQFCEEAIRTGPHPSLYSQQHLEALEAIDGCGVELREPWPFKSGGAETDEAEEARRRDLLDWLYEVTGVEVPEMFRSEPTAAGA